MIFLLPQNPLEKNKPDFGFEEEYEALKLLGQNIMLFDFADMDAGGYGWLQKIPEGEGTLLYRGWMMDDATMKWFQGELEDKGYAFFQNHNDYTKVHYFPYAYMASKTLRKYSPKTVTLPAKYFNPEYVETQLDGKPYIVKDYVKSAKGIDNALVVTDPTNYQAANMTVHNMIRGRKMYGFNEGIVAKEFIDFKKDENGNSLEFRAFFVNGKMISFNANGCENPKYIGDGSMYIHLDRIAKELNVPFLTIDIGIDNDFNFHIVETGAGEVSGLASSANPLVFYKQLVNKLRDA